MDPLLSDLLSLSARHGLLPPGARVLVGCSGGADSLALVHALRTLSPRHGWHIEAAYVHHGLRPEADREAELLAARMAAWSVPFRVARVAAGPAPGQSPEEAARDARYAALNTLARASGATRLALGHHADDQLETILLRLTKGSALPGLLGIPAQREQEEGPCIVRPLLGVSRTAIEAYLARNGLDWFEDESNRDATIPRNRLRHDVTPVLRALNPAIHRTLSLNLAVLADEDDYLSRQAQEAIRPLLRHEGPGLIGLEAAGLALLPPALQRRVLAQAYVQVQGTRRGMTAQRLERIRAAGEGVDVGEGLRAAVQHGLLLLYRVFEAPPPVPALPGVTVALAGMRLGLERAERPFLPTGTASEAFDADHLPSDLVWRLARPDTDRFVPWGRENARPLAQFLAKQRLARPVMERLPVLAAGDDVLWAVGIRRSAHAPIGPATRRIVKAIREKPQGAG